jgi:hypothetical protein
MRLLRAQVEKLIDESKDPAEAATKIMELCGAAMGADARASARVTSERPPGILRSPRFAKTPEWRAGFMLPPPASAKTPQRWPTLPRTKEAWPVGSRSGRAVAIDARATSARAGGPGTGGAGGSQWIRTPPFQEPARG